MWDVFISYAREDKADIARPLAKALQNHGLSVWFDEFELTVGDSLSRHIDKGLAESNYGIVIVSRRFLEKEWPQKELDALISRESSGEKVLLPVWHGIDAKDVEERSPLLASRFAAMTDDGLDVVLAQLLRAMGFRRTMAGISGLWVGRTGRMRLRDKAGKISGDYDWKGFGWAGHVEGAREGDLFRLRWWWDKSREKGRGYFVLDPTERRMEGEWFY